MKVINRHLLSGLRQWSSEWEAYKAAMLASSCTLSPERSFVAGYCFHAYNGQIPDDLLAKASAAKEKDMEEQAL